MTEPEKREFLKKYEAEIISPAEVATWKRGASNAGYHYLGCAKTFATSVRLTSSTSSWKNETRASRSVTRRGAAGGDPYQP